MAFTFVLRPTDRFVLGGNAAGATGGIWLVVANFSGFTDVTVRVVGTDFQGSVQTEDVTVNGNGNFALSKLFKTLTDSWVVAVNGSGTLDYSVVQGQWGVVWKQGTHQYAYDCELRIGDGSTATFFAENKKQITFNYRQGLAYSNIVIYVYANASCVLGLVYDDSLKTTWQGCGISVLRTDGANPKIGAASGATVCFYSCDFRVFRYDNFVVQNQLKFTGYISRIWSCQVLSPCFESVVGCDFFNVLGCWGRNDGFFKNNSNCTFDKVTAYHPYMFATIDGSATYRNTIVKGAPTVFIRYMGGAVGSAYFIDCEADNWGPNLFYNSNPAYRQYSFDLKVCDTDEEGGNPLSGVTCALKDKEGNQVFSLTTSEDGRIATQTVSYALYNQTYPTGYLYSPFVLTLSKAGYMSQSIPVVLDKETALEVSLRKHLAGPSVFIDVGSGKPVLNLNRKKLVNQLVLTL